MKHLKVEKKRNEKEMKRESSTPCDARGGVPMCATASVAPFGSDADRGAWALHFWGSTPRIEFLEDDARLRRAQRKRQVRQRVLLSLTPHTALQRSEH